MIPSRTLQNLAALLLLGTSGSAAAGLADAMAQCKSIADAQARTTCYDAISAVAAEPAAAPPPPATAPAAAAPAAPATAPEAQAPQVIHARLVGEIGGWERGSVLSLDNGSRWKVTTDGRVGFPKRSNPAVTLKRSWLNWWLSLDGTSYRTKVQSVE